jgi:hypothetical protein
MKYLLIFLIVLLLVFLFIKNKGKLFGNKTIKYEKVNVIIDDNIIDKGNINEIIEPVWNTVSIYDGEAKYLNDLRKFSVPQKYVHAIMWYSYEVNNGGHDQFYFNSTGIVWEDALNGLKEVDQIDFYNILKESVQKMGGKPSKDRFERQKQLNKLKPDFEDLDDKFYELEKKTDLDSVLLDYIKKNRTSFYFSGMIERAKLPKK